MKKSARLEYLTYEPSANRIIDESEKIFVLRASPEALKDLNYSLKRLKEQEKFPSYERKTK